MSGPTLNPEYNNLLKRWSCSGVEHLPECEDCGNDMTGQNVTDAPGMWVCETCAKKEREFIPMYREDFESGCYRSY
jgi:hypothetical protein